MTIAYWVVFGIFIATIILGFVVSSKFKKTADENGTIASSQGLTGRQVAEKILAHNGIKDIQIVRGHAQSYSDNFNPQTKTVTLSDVVYDSTSITAISIAAHEVGHVIQYAKGTSLIKIRTALIKPVTIIQGIGQALFQIGLVMFWFVIFWGSTNTILAWSFIGGGVLIAGSTFIFTLVTLPVEYDASKRAKKQLLELEIISDKKAEEYKRVDKVLDSAAKTYLIAFLRSFAIFLLYVLLILSRRN